MDWTAAGVVMTGTALLLGAAIAWLDQRFDLKLSKNNEEMLRLINGSYVKREVYEQNRASDERLATWRFNAEHER